MAGGFSNLGSEFRDPGSESWGSEAARSGGLGLLRIGTRVRESNLPFDPRALTRNPHSGPLAKGKMVEFYQDVKYTLHFLFNPTTIGVGYTMNPDIKAGVNLPESTPGDMGEGIAQQTFEFSIIFNRLYEVAAGDTKGVRKDIEALEHLVGFTEESPVVRYVPLKFIFGKNFVIPGVIQSANVQYQMFSREMVPIHCEVTFQCFRVHALNSSGFDRETIERANEDRLGRITGLSAAITTQNPL